MGFPTYDRPPGTLSGLGALGDLSADALAAAARANRCQSLKLGWRGTTFAADDPFLAQQIAMIQDWVGRQADGVLGRDSVNAFRGWVNSGHQDEPARRIVTLFRFDAAPQPEACADANADPECVDPTMRASDPRSKWPLDAAKVNRDEFAGRQRLWSIRATNSRGYTAGSCGLVWVILSFQKVLDVPRYPNGNTGFDGRLGPNSIEYFRRAINGGGALGAAIDHFFIIPGATLPDVSPHVDPTPDPDPVPVPPAACSDADRAAGRRNGQLSRSVGWRMKPGFDIQDPADCRLPKLIWWTQILAGVVPASGLFDAGTLPAFRRHVAINGPAARSINSMFVLPPADDGDDDGGGGGGGGNDDDGGGGGGGGGDDDPPDPTPPSACADRATTRAAQANLVHASRLGWRVNPHNRQVPRIVFPGDCALPAAVKPLQQAVGKPADGIVGPQTLAAFQRARDTRHAAWPRIEALLIIPRSPSPGPDPDPDPSPGDCQAGEAARGAANLLLSQRLRWRVAAARGWRADDCRLTRFVQGMQRGLRATTERNIPTNGLVDDATMAAFQREVRRNSFTGRSIATTLVFPGGGGGGGDDGGDNTSGGSGGFGIVGAALLATAAIIWRKRWQRRPR